MRAGLGWWLVVMMALGGCVTAERAIDAPPDEQALAITLAVPVFKNGTTTMAACVVPPIGISCPSIPTGNASGDLPVNASPLRFSGTLYWEARSPASERLIFLVGAYNMSDPDRRRTYSEDFRGTSPLSFDFNLTGLEGHLIDWAVVAENRVSAPAVYAYYDAEQDFSLEGIYHELQRPDP